MITLSTAQIKSIGEIFGGPPDDRVTLATDPYRENSVVATTQTCMVRIDSIGGTEEMAALATPKPRSAIIRKYYASWDD